MESSGVCASPVTLAPIAQHRTNHEPHEVSHVGIYRHICPFSLSTGRTQSRFLYYWRNPLSLGGSMARIGLISPEAASPEVSDIYEKVLRGKPGNAQKALAHRPEMLKNFLPFYASVGRSLDRKLYELIYIRVSLINGCHYCTQHHISACKACRVGGRRLGGAEIRQLFAIQREGTGCVDVCGSPHPNAPRYFRQRF